jgi:DNA polymerase III delta prime subunit
MAVQGIVGREVELALLEQRLASRHSFLLYGPAGVGKTALIRALLPEHPEILYCPDSTCKKQVLGLLALRLSERDQSIAHLLAGPVAIRAKSAASLKGFLCDGLRAGKYWIVLDHLRMPSSAFAGDMKDIAGWAMTPVLGIARSDHMEDIGFLRSLFLDRSERLGLRNLDEAQAEELAKAVVESSGLTAANLHEFVTRVVEVSNGNPGAIIAMVEMARLPKYRSGGQVMLSPLYIDLRLQTGL